MTDSSLTNSDARPHLPVLFQEVLFALHPGRAGYFVDATVGAGGHAAGILSAAPEAHLLGFDVDPHALELAQGTLAEFGSRAHLLQTSYTQLAQTLAALAWPPVDGILIDLGLSSMQLDTPERGFSFQSDGPLDMRFDPTQSLRAEDILNTWSERDLADLFWRYGEEPQARRIARAIVQDRPFNSTRPVADMMARIIRSPGRKSSTHPATRAFQALRIVVNHELEALEDFLPQAVAALTPGGRLAVISFHSLEDRIVKQFFRQESRDCICPGEQPVCTCNHRASIREINRKPIMAQDTETLTNPRARSARLRVIEKISPSPI